jgi:hypothetical protein
MTDRKSLLINGIRKHDLKRISQTELRNPLPTLSLRKRNMLRNSIIEEESNELNTLDMTVDYLPFPGKMLLSEYEDLVTYFVQKWRNDRANYLHIEETSSGLQPFTKDL